MCTTLRFLGMSLQLDVASTPSNNNMRSYDSFESLLVRVKDNDLHAWVLLGATLGVTTHLRCHYIEPTAL